MDNKNAPLNLNSKQKNIDEKIRYDLFSKSVHAATSPSFNKYEFVNEEGFDPFLQSFYLEPIITVDVILPKYLLMSDFYCNYIIVELDKVTDDDRQIIQKLLSNNAIKVFKEGKAVIKALNNAGYSISQPYFDITLAALVLDSGLGDATNYDNIVAKYAKSVSKHYDYLSWNYGITKSHIKSVAHSTALMLELMVLLKAGLAASGLSSTAALEFLCLPAIVELELNGIGFNEERWNKAEQNICDEKKVLENELEEALGKWDFNESNQLLAAVNNHGISVRSISKESLLEYSSSQYTIIKTLLNYLSVSRFKQYFKSFYIHLSKHNNRLYPTYNQVCKTGRIYCGEPNIQQWPKRNDFRKCIIASEGMKLIDADYSQIELRIAAEITQDSIMIKAFKDGADLHRLTASIILEKNYEDITDKERQSAKTVNFGLIYGMSAMGLKKRIYQEYSINVSELEAEKFIYLFFQNYKGIANWQNKIIRLGKNESRTLNGRRRLWNDTDISKTALINSPIQGTGADILKKALSLLQNRLKDIGGKIVGVIHDEIICEVPNVNSQEGEKILRDTMCEAGKFFIKSVPIVVETKIIDNWAESN